MASASATLSLRRAMQVSQVKSLYRRSLKNTLNWAIFRDIFYEEADKLRLRFESHRHVGSPEAIDKLIAQGEAELQKNIHPDPYLIPTVYGGSKYERNPPVPENIHVVLNYGKE